MTEYIEKVEQEKIKEPDLQYKFLIEHILEKGERVQTPQEVDAITCFGTAPILEYDLDNGMPIITERKLGIKGPIGEMCAFINGEQNFDVMKAEYGVAEAFWGPWTTKRKTEKVGAKDNHLGDGSYGPAFAAFPDNEGGTYDQIENVIRMLKDEELRDRRTIYVTSWIPYMNGWGRNQRAVVSPCHGNLHFRVVNDELHLLSWHRSADILLGLPNDMISYCALIKMVENITDIKAKKLIFQFGDAHIYENQLKEATDVLNAETNPFPELEIVNKRENIRDFRSTDFELVGYNPNPRMNIPSAI